LCGASSPASRWAIFHFTLDGNHLYFRGVLTVRGGTVFVHAEGDHHAEEMLVVFHAPLVRKITTSLAVVAAMTPDGKPWAARMLISANPIDARWVGRLLRPEERREDRSIVVEADPTIAG
jgi:hypothetical protein